MCLLNIKLKKSMIFKLEMKVYCASELFQVSNRNEKNFIHDGGKIKNYHYPFNFEFKKGKYAVDKDNKGEFYGSGIYLITFNDADKYNEDVIYIGKYMPYGKGNVISDRWIKHIATITNRGHRISGFGKKNKKYELLEKIGFLAEKSIDNYKAFVLKAGRMEGDYSTSVKRLEFAKDNWHTFKGNIENFREDVLPKFQFHYMQFNGHKESEIPDSVKIKEYYENLASLVETYLLWKYNPVCNSNEGLKEMDGITSSKIETEINSFLEKLN